jgi:predicted RNA-binding protein associated with RNAse of E/G family
VSDLPRVRIHYRRPPDRLQIFEQVLVHDEDDVKVTLAESLDFDPPLRIHDDVVLETGSPVVWFTFPGRWYDVGRFHRADGTFTGLYANLLTPPVIRGLRWETTDLFLDVWIPPRGHEACLLDEEELEVAVEREWVAPDTALRVRREAHELMNRARRGAWPPAVVHDWTLERCRTVREGRVPSTGHQGSGLDAIRRGARATRR